MTGGLVGFIICGLVGCLFIVLGICSARSKTPAGFWANVETFEVTDVDRYNHAVARLFCAFGVVLILMGIPLLFGKDAWVLLSVLGCMIMVIVLMAVYILVIEKKYKKMR